MATALAALLLSASPAAAAADIVIPPLPAKMKASAADKARAAEAFTRAETAYQAGELAPALAAADEAFLHLPNASTCLLRAVMLSELERHRDAFEAFLLASELAPTADEEALIREGLARHGKALDPPLGWLIVVVDPSGADVTLDGTRFATPRAVGLAAGHHRVRVEAPGYEPTTGGFTVHAGMGQRLEYKLNATPKEPPPTVDPPPTPPLTIELPATPPPDRGQSLAWVLVGSGAALVVGGLAGHVWALDAADKTERFSRPVADLDEATRRARHDDAAKDAVTGRTLAVTLYALGAVAAGTGVALLLTADDELLAPATVAPLPLEGGGGVSLSTCF